MSPFVVTSKPFSFFETHTPLAEQIIPRGGPVNNTTPPRPQKKMHVPTVMPYGLTSQAIPLPPLLCHHSSPLPRWPHWSRGMPLCKPGLSRFPLAFIFIRDVFVFAQPPGTTSFWIWLRITEALLPPPSQINSDNLLLKQWIRAHNKKIDDKEMI